MSRNPLNLPSTAVSSRGPLYPSQDWCDQRNASMDRRDIMWMPNGNGGAFLTERPEWSEANAKRIKATAAREAAIFAKYHWQQVAD